jgi:hypothetical protein
LLIVKDFMEKHQEINKSGYLVDFNDDHNLNAIHIGIIVIILLR